MISQQQVTSKTSIPVGEHLFDETVQLTEIIEYGVSWQALTSGQVAIPAEGARFDIGFEGTLAGPKLKGRLKGMDFLLVRADGHFQLNIHVTITTDDGEKIAVYEDGILIPPVDERRIAQLRLNLRFTTASTKYAWVNQLQAWGRGEIDWNTGGGDIQVYAA